MQMMVKEKKEVTTTATIFSRPVIIITTENVTKQVLLIASGICQTHN
jgi:hypothetical protein